MAKRIRRRVPAWSGDDAASPQVLLVDRDGASSWAHEQELRRAGYGNVVHCGGPHGPHDCFPYGDCRLFRGGHCPLAEGADVVVFNLTLAESRTVEVLAAYRSRFPDLPVCVEIPAPQIAEGSAELDGCELIPHPATGGRVVAAVDRVLGRTAAVS